LKSINNILAAIILLVCCGCKDSPNEIVEEPIQKGERVMVLLETELPLAKEEWSPEPPQRSSQAFMVPEGTKLLSRGAKVTSTKDPFLLVGDLAMITDGNVKQDSNYHVELWSYDEEFWDGPQWVQIELEKTYAIYAILVWHYYLPDSREYDYYKVGEDTYLARVYQDVVVQISNDPDFQKSVTTVYNNDHDNSSGLGTGMDAIYVETSEGRWINVQGVEGKYVRLYSWGHKRLWGSKDETPEKYSGYPESNDYIEVEVYGKQPPDIID
jgi:hypothetical protein